MKFHAFFHSQHSHDNQLPDEEDVVPVPFVSAVVVISFLVVLIVCIFSYPLLVRTTGHLQKDADLGAGHKHRMEYLENAQQKLNSYDKLKNDQYQIPIDLAMKKVLDQQQR